MYSESSLPTQEYQLIRHLLVLTMHSLKGWKLSPLRKLLCEKNGILITYSFCHSLLLEKYLDLNSRRHLKVYKQKKIEEIAYMP